MRCQTSIVKTLGLVVGAVLLLAACWYCTTIPRLEAQVAGWVGLVFFGLCFVAILIQLFRGRPSVILDEAGIHDLRSFGTIPWTDIISLRIGSVINQRFLCIEVRDPETYVSRLPARKRVIAQANPSLGFPPITISFSGLSPGLVEVWSYIQASHPEKMATSPGSAASG
jgi:hypothetical protein